MFTGDQQHVKKENKTANFSFKADLVPDGALKEKKPSGKALINSLINSGFSLSQPWLSTMTIVPTGPKWTSKGQKPPEMRVFLLEEGREGVAAINKYGHVEVGGKQHFRNEDLLLISKYEAKMSSKKVTRRSKQSLG